MKIIKSSGDSIFVANIREDELHGSSDRSLVDSKDSERIELAKEV